jgi:glycosidase
MQWNGSSTGGFTTGTPWLPPNEPQLRNVADREQGGNSVLEFFRRPIHLRRDFGPGIRLLDSPPGTVVLERGGHPQRESR